MFSADFWKSVNFCKVRHIFLISLKLNSSSVCSWHKWLIWFVFILSLLKSRPQLTMCWSSDILLGVSFAWTWHLWLIIHFVFFHFTLWLDIFLQGEISFGGWVVIKRPNLNAFFILEAKWRVKAGRSCQGYECSISVEALTSIFSFSIFTDTR